MITKHTPGPWVAEYYDRVDSKSGQIAVLNKGLDECAGNARLIAAAPDLLHVLRLVKIGSATPEEIDAAIAKATGGAE